MFRQTQIFNEKLMVNSSYEFKEENTFFMYLHTMILFFTKSINLSKQNLV